MSDHLHERAQLMESLFYQQRDQELLQRIRDAREADDLRSQLTAASGLDDAEALDSLIDVGVTADSLTAVAMIPLVAVAWADRQMESAEKDAILQAAADSGISNDGGSYELLQDWLSHRPDKHLLEAWEAYIHAIREHSNEATINQLKSVVMGKAKQVAEATGGILGFGNKTSEAEQKVLDELSAAFGS